MCGIAALLAVPAEPLADLISRMTELVRHRGPDDEGYALFAADGGSYVVAGGADTADECYTYDSPYAPRSQLTRPGPPSMLALGHRRLSIVDVTAAGHQPMSTHDGRFWICYNGEVYNYIELRAELARLGHVFRTNTDTEVLLTAYREWGRDCLSRLNGMFAFLIFDRETRILFAARDRFGVKPLYYWRSPTGLIAFASEIKQFTVLPGWNAKLDPQRSYDFLQWKLLDHTDGTLFAGVRQIRNGETVEIDLGRASPTLNPDALPTRTWYVPRAAPFEGDFAKAAGRFREILTDSVALRLRADVAVGSCLSGGLDSSSIVCLMSSLLASGSASASQKTFSACSTERQFDERPFMESVARAARVDSHYVYPQQSRLFAELDDLIWLQDEPFGSTSIYAQWNVFRIARESGVTVMLDGQGADEILGGYHFYFGPYLASLLLTLRLGTLAREIRGLGSLHGYRPAWAIQRMADSILPDSVRRPLSRYLGPARYSSGLIDSRRLGAEIRDPTHGAGGGGYRSVAALSYAQLTKTNLQMLLHWEDRNSMAHSIEARVPFLDYRLVEFALGLPDAFKMEDGVTKRILREAMKDVLPEDVRLRNDKLGFATPEERWVTRDDREGFRAAVRDAVEACGDMLTAAAPAQLESMIDGRIPFSDVLWRVICFGRWVRGYSIGR